MPRGFNAPMEAGERDWMITIQSRPLEAEADDSGAPVETWTDLVTMPAAKYDVSGQEKFTAQQLSAAYDIRWEINYRADMDPELLPIPKVRRVLHRGRVHDIVDASMIGRREGIKLLTLSKMDTA